MKDENIKILFDKETLKNKVSEIGKKISEDYKNKKLLVVCVLKGSFIFMADLVREINIPVRIEFLRASSYKGKNSGRLSVDENSMKTLDISEYHVIIVEDILDTGKTLFNISEMFRMKNPVSLRICVLLDKPSRRTAPVYADYIGFTVPDKFVIGYGLDCDEQYRNLSYVGELIC